MNTTICNELDIDDRLPVIAFTTIYKNNQFNRAISLVDLFVYHNPVLAIQNNVNDNYTDDEFFIDVIDKSIIDTNNCKWSVQDINLLYKWIEINFSDLMLIWNDYQSNNGYEKFDEFTIMNNFKVAT